MGAKELKEKLFYTNKNGLKGIDEALYSACEEYCEGYKKFLDKAKTEREAVETALQMAKEKGFVPFEYGKKYNVGDKVYFNNRGKMVAFAVIGKESPEKGINITAAHIDSPRFDLKPIPLFESNEICFLKTRY